MSPSPRRRSWPCSSLPTTRREPPCLLPYQAYAGGVELHSESPPRLLCGQPQAMTSLIDRPFYVKLPATNQRPRSIDLILCLLYGTGAIVSYSCVNWPLKKPPKGGKKVCSCDSGQRLVRSSSDLRSLVKLADICEWLSTPWVAVLTSALETAPHGPGSGAVSFLVSITRPAAAPLAGPANPCGSHALRGGPWG